MKRYTMMIFKTSQGYMVRSDDPEVRELFGTDILPTSYTAQADAARVLAAISAQNPDRDVKLA